MLTKIDFCRATGHDHDGWQVTSAGVTETTSMAEAAAVEQKRHWHCWWRKHWHRIIVDDGDGTMTMITMTMTATVMTTTV